MFFDGDPAAIGNVTYRMRGEMPGGKPGNLVDLGAQVAETIVAAASVIDYRSRAILALAYNPCAGDYAELGRLVPEKIDALTRAGIAGLAACCTLHAELWSFTARTTGLAARGFPPSAREFGALAEDIGHFGEVTTAAVQAVFAPIHDRVMSNAQRLQRDGTYKPPEAAAG